MYPHILDEKEYCFRHEFSKCSFRPGAKYTEAELQQALMGLKRENRLVREILGTSLYSVKSTSRYTRYKYIGT